MTSSPTLNCRRQYRDAAALAIIAMGVLAVPVFFGVPYSVGIVGALRILEGDIPYRDFWTMYAPGHFYLLALLFLVFGKHLVIASAAKAVFVAACSSVLFLIARDLKVTRPIAATVGGFFVVMMWNPGFGLSTYEPAFLFILIGWLLTVRGGQLLSPRRALAIGASFGIAAWFKHDIAVYAVIAVAIGHIVEHFGTEQRRWTETARGVVLIAAGSIAMVLPVALWCWLVAGRDAWQDVVWFPLTDFPKLRRTVYPGLLPDLVRMTDTFSTAEAVLEWCQFNVPVLLLIGWVVALARDRARRASYSSLVVVLIPSLALFWLAAHVRISTHIYTISAIALLLGGVAWTQSRALALGSMQRVAATLIALGYGASLLVEPGKAAIRVARAWPTSRTSQVPTLRSLIVPARDLEYYEPIARLIERSIPQSERIYVGMSRHDVLISSNSMVYAVVDRHGASRYDELHAAVADRADVQREIIDAINRNGVRLVVLWQFGRPAGMLDSLKAARSRDLPNSGATVLDEFLARGFRRIAQYGEYHVLWRVDAVDP
jgi:hypothetical protein